MKPCVACGFAHPLTSIVEPGSPARAANLDALPGDTLRIVERVGDEHRDPFAPPRFVLGVVTDIVVLASRVVVSVRVVSRGTDERSAESRRARLVAALASTGSHVGQAALVLGISIREAYRWVHELGLESSIRTYRPRTRTRVKGGTDERV